MPVDQPDLKPDPDSPSEAKPESKPVSSPIHDVKGYWRANLRIIGVLMSIWAIVSFGMGIFFVQPLNQFSVGHLPAGFWMAQQGSIVVFVLLIFVYAFWMDRLDKKFGVKDK